MKDEEKISRILASLETIEAPKNFEGLVRTRIAERRNDRSVSGPRMLLVAKFAFPLLLLVAVGAFLVVSNDRGFNTGLVPPVGDSTREVAAFDDPSNLPAAAANNDNTSTAQVPLDRGKGNSRRVRPDSLQDDQALSQDDTTLFPDGVDPRRTAVTNSVPPTGGSISPASILSMIGISSDCSSAGCVATLVREGSIAGRAGIQKGDLISEIDGRPVNVGFTGQFTVSEITLTRSGRRMTLSIKRR